MKVTELLRKAYPNVLEGMFFTGQTQQEVYVEFLRVISSRLPKKTTRVGLSAIAEYERTQLSTVRGLVDDLLACYSDDNFGYLLDYLTRWPSYGRDDVGLRDMWAARGTIVSQAKVVGDLDAVLMRYLGSEFVARSTAMHAFANALALLYAEESDSSLDPLQRILLSVSQPKQPKVLTQIQRWSAGMAPDWAQLLSVVEYEMGPMPVHKALVRVGLKRADKTTKSSFRTELEARLASDTCLRLTYTPDYEVGRRLFNSLSRYYRVTPPKTCRRDAGFLSEYLADQQLLSRMPCFLAQSLREILEVKPAERDWSSFFRELESSCPVPLHILIEETPPTQEKKDMATITDAVRKTAPSAVQTTFETVKEATKHGVAVATADGLANTALRTGMKLVPQLEHMDLTPEAASFVKYGAAVAAIGLAESGVLPGVDPAAVTAGAALVIEAAARDGFQPLVEAFSPLIEQLATAGAKALKNAGKDK